MLCSLLAVCLLLSVRASAAQLPQELAERFGLSALEADMPPELEDWDLTVGKAIALTPSELVNLARAALRKKATACRGAVLSLLGLSLLAGAARQIGGEGLLAETASVLSALLVVLTVRSPMLFVLSGAAATIRHAAKFLIVFVPVYAGVTAAGGAAASASAYQVLLLAFAEALAGGISAVLLPLCLVLFELCIAETLACGLLPRWSLFVKRAVCLSLALATTVFCGFLSLQTALTGAADHTAAKTAKLLAEAFVPVIGKAVADGVAAAQGGVRILRSAVGSFGIAAAAALFLPSVLETGLLRLGLFAAEVSAGLFEASGVSQVLRAFGQMLEVVLALLLALALLLIASTAILLSAGGAA